MRWSGLCGGYVIDAGIALPVFNERMGLFVMPRSVLDGDIPNEVCSRRLTSIEWNKYDDRVFPRPPKCNSCRFDAYIGANLRFADATCFVNKSSSIAGLSVATAPSDYPQADGRSGQNARKTDKPEGEIGDGIALRLFPKAVGFAFLGGAFVGCGIVAWAVIQGQCDKISKMQTRLTRR